MSDALVRICIAGGRDFDDIEFLFNCMEAVRHLYWNHEIVVVSGACKGADKLGERWARDYGYRIDSRPPNYEAFKGNERYAPLARNEEMAKESDVLCAFWHGSSKGTAHMIGQAMEKGLELHVFRYNNNRGEEHEQDSLDLVGGH